MFKKELLKRALEVVTGVAFLTLAVRGNMAYATTTGDGLYNTFSNIYGSVTGTGSSSSSSADTTYSSSNTTTTGSIINGRPVITYYAIGKDVTVTTTEPSSNETVSGNSASTNSKTTTTTTFVQEVGPLESNPIGPQVNTVSLSESYHENYKVYEERFDEVYAIYTNIQSGTITNKPVVFDVPNGVVVRMTRDGQECGFTNKQKIETEGTYVVYFYATEDSVENLPAWAQTIDRASFNFRIQYEALDGSSLETTETSELESFADYANEGQEQITEETAEPENTEPQEEAAEEVTEEVEEKSFDGVVTVDNVFDCEYDSSTGYYRYDLLTGDSFFANIPNGMTTNNSVMFSAADDIRYELYKNGEQIEYNAGDYITVAGSYVMIPVIDNLDYEGYYRTTRPMVRFRIIAGAVSDMATFTAPVGLNFDTVRFNLEDVTDTAKLSENVVSMPEDGTWVIDMSGDAGTYTTTIVRDTKAPMIIVETEPNIARISYDSDDIVSVVLKRGEEVISEDLLVTQVTEAGRYTLTATDQAGNSETVEFSVQYRINGYAILAIVMIVALIAAVFLFLHRSKTKVRVR
ncbi:MAG: hypothetical protein K6A23_06155 [Butyrivibrio sp.]|nr:hypothetical protein [Butyrivibrio sp.]